MLYLEHETYKHNSQLRFRQQKPSFDWFVQELMKEKQNLKTQKPKKPPLLLNDSTTSEASEASACFSSSSEDYMYLLDPIVNPEKHKTEHSKKTVKPAPKRPAIEILPPALSPEPISLNSPQTEKENLSFEKKHSEMNVFTYFNGLKTFLKEKGGCSLKGKVALFIF